MISSNSRKHLAEMKLIWIYLSQRHLKGNRLKLRKIKSKNKQVKQNSLLTLEWETSFRPSMVPLLSITPACQSKAKDLVLKLLQGWRKLLMKYIKPFRDIFAQKRADQKFNSTHSILVQATLWMNEYVPSTRRTLEILSWIMNSDVTNYRG